MDKRYIYTRLALIACLMTFIVIGAGVFTRLVDAGLGCPDWPGCYGHLTPPVTQAGHVSRQLVFPNNPLNSYKAWTEMIHRYLAKALGLLVLVMAVMTIACRPLRADKFNIHASIAMVVLLLVQVVLGMFTVTLKLMPLVVTLHLFGALALLSCLWLLYLRNQTFEQAMLLRSRQTQASPYLVSIVIGAVILIVVQIFTGVWTSTHYAALSCPDFPFCYNQHHWMPMDFHQAFNLLPAIGVNYEGGVLPLVARQSIQMIHRLGALLLLMYMLCLVLTITCKQKYTYLRQTGCLMLVLLLIQITLGISNVIFKLPLVTAVSHTLVAALLMLTSMTLLFKLLAMLNYADDVSIVAVGHKA